MDLEQFRREVQRRVTAANAEPKWSAEAAAQYMAGLEPRRKRFLEVARRLIADVIEPRMPVVAGQFVNAQADRNAHDDRSVWWFGFCERFPVTARLEISVGHNETIEQVQVRYELDLMPTFSKYDSHDRFAMPLDAVDDDISANWVEQKILDFLSTYLTVDRGRDDFEDESVTDPVCGMRIRRSAAVASCEFKGHPYFFCSPACRGRFDAAPEHYVTVRV
ncbi:MAG: YHS domain-containing protein [Pirellulales bacterium]